MKDSRLRGAMTYENLGSRTGRRDILGCGLLHLHAFNGGSESSQWEGLFFSFVSALAFGWGMHSEGGSDLVYSVSVCRPRAVLFPLRTKAGLVFKAAGQVGIGIWEFKRMIFPLVQVAQLSSRQQ